MSKSNTMEFRKFGQIQFGELISTSAHDFEKSFSEYLSVEEELTLMSKFGQVKFAEIENDELKDFARSFNQYFF